MSSNNSQTNEKLPVKPAPRLSFCQRRKSESGSFMSQLRNHFHEFIHASMDEHRTCLRNTIQKILNAAKDFGEKRDSPNEGESSLALQSTAKD